MMGVIFDRFNCNFDLRQSYSGQMIWPLFLIELNMILTYGNYTPVKQFGNSF